MANLAIPLGIGLVTSIASSLLTPPTEGPRLDDLTFPKSEWGQQKPIFWGRVRVGGNVIAATKLKEKKNKTKSGKAGGGKGGGGFGKQVNYTYTADQAVLFSQGRGGGLPIAGIARIWANREVKYDVRVGTSNAIAQSSQRFKDTYLRIYLGSDAQPPDPVIQSFMGVANTPAYRNRVYITLDDYPVEGQVSWEAELYSHASVVGGKLQPLGVPLSQIITDISSIVGINAIDLDVSELTDLLIDGFFIQSPGAAKNALSQLLAAYFIDAIETGDKIRFQRRNRPTITNFLVPFEILGAHEYGESRGENFSDRWTDSGPLPRELSLTFLNPETNYERDVVRTFRQNSPNSNSQAVDLPIILNTETAQRTADRYLFEQWIQRREITISLPPNYLGLEPGDLLQVDLYGGAPELLQAKTVTLGANYLIEVICVPYAGAFPILGGTGEQGRYFEPRLPGSITLGLLDIPLLRDTDPDWQLPVSVRGENFDFADIYISRDYGQSYSLIKRLFAESTAGITLTALSGYPAGLNQDDLTNSLTVRLYTGELESISQERYLTGENLALVGNELIWFRSAAMQADGSYVLSHLRRGRRGTDRWRAGHVPNERFVLLPNGFSEKIQLQPKDVDLDLIYFKALAPGESLDQVSPFTLDYQGETQRAYSPQNLQAARLSADFIQISWQRRDRRAGERDNYLQLPNTEGYEQYRITFFAPGGTQVVRELFSSTPSINYGFVQQDFGAAPATFDFQVQQGSPLDWGTATRVQVTV